jgi:hypothetical protein
MRSIMTEPNIARNASSVRISFKIFSRIEQLLRRLNFNLREKLKVQNRNEVTGVQRESRSETYQDFFAYQMGKFSNLNTYLEIGAGHPSIGNNTYLLERQGWRGISVEIESSLVELFQSERKNKIYLADAIGFDYLNALDEIAQDGFIGYLQIDIDPSIQSLRTLMNIPFDSYKFASITFEHDIYRSSRRIRKAQRRYLQSFGYVLIAKDVKFNEIFSYEDWWVHPDLVDLNILTNFRSSRIHPFRMNWSTF